MHKWICARKVQLAVLLEVIIIIIIIIIIIVIIIIIIIINENFSVRIVNLLM